MATVLMIKKTPVYFIDYDNLIIAKKLQTKIFWISGNWKN
jgi:hypothetical protein